MSSEEKKYKRRVHYSGKYPKKDWIVLLVMADIQEGLGSKEEYKIGVNMKNRLF